MKSFLHVTPRSWFCIDSNSEYGNTSIKLIKRETAEEASPVIGFGIELACRLLGNLFGLRAWGTFPANLSASFPIECIISAGCLHESFNFKVR